MSSKQVKSLAVVVIVTLFALGFAWLAGSSSVAVAGYSAVFVAAIIALAINWIAFVPSAIAQSDKFYDTMGAVTYLSVAGFAAWVAWPLDLRGIVIAVMVAIWCLRLGTFLFIRIHAMGGSDSRFEKIKNNPARFLAAWTLQALWVILTASAAIIAITTTNRVPVDLFFYIGAAVWLFGIIFETVADQQKSAFKSDSSNKGDFIDVGLWRWSRHPNYFGEITLWTGILIMAIPVLSGWSWLAVISPIFVTLLLTKISGINLQEKQAKERWGDDPAYQEYRRKTPVLIPRPPSK
jgi:steroid 5-alpha reductase family enzyme